MKQLTLSEIASLWGRAGGLSRSPAKIAASRRNGLLGGRPRMSDSVRKYIPKESKAGLTSKRGNAPLHSKQKR